MALLTMGFVSIKLSLYDMAVNDTVEGLNTNELSDLSLNEAFLIAFKILPCLTK